jgi:cell division septum initiation protein DivIVA
LTERPPTTEERPSTGLSDDLSAEVEKDQLPRALFGYERSTIVELLDTMSGRIRALGQERAERDRRIAELETELRRTHENQRLIGETLVKAREEATAIREEARRSAEKDLRAARKQGERIVEEAEHEGAAQAKATLEATQRECQTLIDEAQRERQSLLNEAGRARAFVDQTHEQLSDFLLAAVRWYEQAKPAGERTPQGASDQPDASANDRSSMPPSLSAALTRESQSTPSSTERSAE